MNNNATNLPNNLRYGNAYVPVQQFRTVFSPRERLRLWNNVSRISFPIYAKSIT